MDRLWAPWRMAYVKAGGIQDGPADFIAFYDQQTNDRENLVIDRSEHAIILLNRYPYSNGHVLVAPRRAVADIEEMTDDELLDCQRQIQRVIRAMRPMLQAEGFNVGLNLGRAAGAGLPGHLHWHVVPRWPGDTNFMTLLTDVRIIIESLDELWLRLRAALGLAVE